MNGILDSWISPWRALHKRLAMETPPPNWKLDQTPGADSWLSQARAAAETIQVRADSGTDH